MYLYLKLNIVLLLCIEDKKKNKNLIKELSFISEKVINKKLIVTVF